MIPETLCRECRFYGLGHCPYRLGERPGVECDAFVRETRPYWKLAFFGEYLERVKHTCSNCGFSFVSEDGLVNPRKVCDGCGERMSGAR